MLKDLRFMYDGFAISIRGYKHIVENIARQDNAMFHVDPEGWAMAAVADGHGGDEYFRSHIGSRFAVESALLSIKDCFHEKGIFLEALRSNPDEILRRLESNIINNWNTLVGRFNDDPQAFDWNSLPAGVYEAVKTDADAPIQNGICSEWEKAWMAEHDVGIREDHIERMYGCTLLAAVMAPEFCLSLQIGDGCCVLAYPNGDAEMMIPPDKSKPRNLTDSLCENTALKKFRYSLVLYKDQDSEPVEAETVNAPETDAVTSCTAEAVSGIKITDAVETAAETEIPDEQEFAVDTPETECEAEPLLEMEATTTRESATIPAGIILSTDGLLNSFEDEPYLESFLRFNRRVLGNMETSVRNDFSGKLETHLNERSEKGSKDDISIAMIFGGDIDFEAVKPG